MESKKNRIMPGIIGGLLGGIGGIAQSLIDRKTQERNIDMTNSANMKMAEYQYSKDLDMWNRANEYNSPSSQMNRLNQAGLNPNLIYGGGVSGAVGNTATTLPKYNAPQLNYNYRNFINPLQVLSAFQDFNIKQAQTDNIRQIADVNRINKELKLLDSTIKSSTMGETVELLRNKVSKSRTEYERSYWEGEMSKVKYLWQKDFINADLNLKRSQNEAYQTNILRTKTDTAIRNINLAWMKKLGVGNFGAIVNAVSNFGRMFK